jgi:hypothetical protein
VIPSWLRLVGTCKPPFLLKVHGNLTHFGAPGEEAPRVVEVVTIEPQSEPDREIVVCTDLRCIKIEPLGRERRPYAFTPKERETLRRNRVAFIGDPSAPTFLGRLQVVDLWDPLHTEWLPIRGDVHPAVRVTPTAITLVPGDRVQGAATLLVTTREPAPRLTVLSDCDELEVRRGGLHQSERFHRWRVVWKGPAPYSGERIQRILLRRDPASTDETTVHMAIRGRDSTPFAAHSGGGRRCMHKHLGIDLVRQEGSP